MRVLEEEDRESQNWNRIVMENLPSRTSESRPSTLDEENDAMKSVGFEVSRYLLFGLDISPVAVERGNLLVIHLCSFVCAHHEMVVGLSREAVPFAVPAYGDNPTKVQQFVNGYTLLREMGFSSTRITDALITYENDTDKALAHFLNSSS